MTQTKLQSAQAVDSAVRIIRAALLVILVAGMLGMGTELVLMEHFEDALMMIPLGLIGLGLLAVIAHATFRSRATVRAFQVSMLLMIIGGGLGTFLHHRAKEGFQLETQPNLSGMALFWKATRGTTPPSLAPAALIQTGLLGLIWAYRHPATRRNPQPQPEV